MRIAIQIVLIIFPIFIIGQDLNHWFSEEFDDKSKESIPENKIALIIANTDYDNKNLDLKNPTNDADTIAAALRKLDFELTVLKDLNRATLKSEIIKFRAKIDKNDFSIIYYAGHAMQDQNGNSFLLPTDFDVGSSLEDSAVSLIKTLNLIESMSKPSLLILDACRETANNGLPKPDIEDPLNVKLAFSTAFGKYASDDQSSKNTIYTSILSKLILIEGLTVYEILHNTSKFVLKKTENSQYPVHYFGIVTEDIQFKR